MISIDNLSYSISRNYKISIEKLNIGKSMSVLFTGANGCGKTTMAKLISGQLDGYQGTIDVPEQTAWLSFDLEAEILAEDRKNDDSEFNGDGIDMGRSAIAVVTDQADRFRFPISEQHVTQALRQNDVLNNVTELLQIESLLTKPFKVLSTGETRKVLIAKALLTKPKLLILDNPYAGLDFQSQHFLSCLISDLIKTGLQILIFDFYREDLPPEIEHIGYLVEGELVAFDHKEQLVNSDIWQWQQSQYQLPEQLTETSFYPELSPELPLLNLTDVTVSFTEKVVFNRLNWQFDHGQHWQILGPNGSGKSTLLAMISGDSSKAYGQDIVLFGRKRGTGESIWDIKKHYGIVSNALHRDSLRTGTVQQTLISGFYDSIGLYNKATKQQVVLANQWLALLGLLNKRLMAFKDLSYGEQRLVLIARAMVKMPLILILDEPCQGLDNTNKAKVLALIDHIALHGRSHILFVSHNPSEQLRCISHQLIFEPSEQGYLARVNELG